MSQSFKEAVNNFGFAAQILGETAEDWMKARASRHLTVAAWTGTTLQIHDGNGVHEEAGVDSIWKALNLFSLGAYDFLLCEREYIEFPLQARALLDIMVKVHSLKHGSDAEKAALKLENESQPISLPEGRPFLESQDPFQLNLWGKALSLEDRYSEAGSAFRQAAELDTHFGEPCSNLGTLLWKLGKRHEAFVMFSEGFMRNPNALSCQLNFFDAGYELKEYESMSRFLEPLVAKYPECIEFKHHLALSYEKTDRRAEACAVLQSVLKENPQDEDARSYLAAIQPEVLQATPGAL